MSRRNTTVSIYHKREFGDTPTIRFNLAAVKRLLPEYPIDDFELNDHERETMQRRVNLYIRLGGHCDFSGGVEATPERWVGRDYIPGQSEVPPSLDHLPKWEILERAVRIDQRAGVLV